MRELDERNFSILTSLIKQVELELEGMHNHTSGVNKFDYMLGAIEALNRLKDISCPNKYKL